MDILSGKIFNMACTGGTTYTDGKYTIHKFTSSGTFGLDITRDIQALVVGGGGGGGKSSSGGGGAGGVAYAVLSLASGNYSVTVGDGGTFPSGGSGNGGNGGNSVFSTVTAVGGGGGATGSNAGLDGGSGGGGGESNATGGSPTTGQGYAGGGNNGGGGGADGVGGNGFGAGSDGYGGDGVSGAYNDLLIASSAGVDIAGAHWIAGGGAGYKTGPTNTIGGKGGGGNTTEAGVVNTGGGGGADGVNSIGGSGLVILRYVTNPNSGFFSLIFS
jgi:hypothetical protein